MSSAAGAPAARVSGLQATSLYGACIVGFSISWNIANVGPVATLLSRRYGGASLAVIGLLTTALFVAELALMIPGGRAIDRHGAKRVAVLAIAISLAANLLLMVPPDPAAALALRMLAGAGVGLGFLAGAIFTQSGSGRARALRGGIYGGVSLSAGGLALATVPLLVGPLGWRAPYASAAAVSALGILLMTAAPVTPGHGAGRRGPRVATLLADKTLLRFGLMSAVSFGFAVILGIWVVTLLERTGGLARGTAGAIGSLILILGIIGRPAGGLLAAGGAPRARRALAASFVAGALGTALLALSAGVALDTAGAALAGLAAGIPFGVTVAGATRAFPRSAGAAVGAMNIYPVLVIVCGAPLVGLTFAMPGQGRIGFAALAVLWAGALALVPGVDS